MNVNVLQATNHWATNVLISTSANSMFVIQMHHAPTLLEVKIDLKKISIKILKFNFGKNCLGFECECNAGYNGDGMTCDDDNECNDNPCHETASCQNTLGSYTCGCPSGFEAQPGTSGNDLDVELG